ncbi:SMC-Scp complex subunit ScpB [Candidatus Micrarchaeota archaeon]|nr:SMC-Scp complex subunit ScpB [Candidatus Micrarchaeota archaeon]
MTEEKRLIEAALFISARPMSVEEFRTLTGIGALGYLQNAIKELQKEYQGRGSAIEIAEADGKYMMKIKTDYVERVREFAQDTEIGRSALRTLAFISKHDGILKSELVKKMGSHVYQNVQELTDAGFVKQQKAGRSSKLILTNKFRTYFEKKEEAAVKINAEEEI